MRLFFCSLFAVMLLAGPVWAQEDDVMTATTALQSVLSNLKHSVEKLDLDNDQLAVKDKYVKQQVLQLQEQLGRFQARGDVLNKAADKLQDKTPRRSQQITRLEEENFDLDNRTQKAEAGIKLIQQSMDAGYQEDQKLLLQLKEMTSFSPQPLKAKIPESQETVHRQKEKLRLMKMIYDSQQRQESLHQAILDFQKNTPLQPAASALAHQQLLKEQIKDLETQLAAYPSAKSGLREQTAGPQSEGVFWGGTQLHQMELELKTLERNYLQLKHLMGQMSKKAQISRMTLSEHVEEEKLQGSIDDLTRQGKALMADLDDLRSQMVDLDKRKTHLEAMVKKYHQ